MQTPSKVVIVSQHYPPDRSTTAAILSKIAEHLATEHPVLVLSGTPGSVTKDAVPEDQPVVIEIKNRIAAKGALVKRAVVETSFALRAFTSLLKQLQRGDVVVTVTAPFTLPYAVAAAARLKRAQSILIMHDLYPDVLVAAGLLKPMSVLTRAIRGANSLMFCALSAVVTIGRDTERLLLRYRSLARDKIRFIPNWATLAPGVRPIPFDNFFRRKHAAHFVVGLAGNLGFTHDPVIVFEAAQLLRHDQEIHFLLSGWGMGYDELKLLQSNMRLPNVTLIDRVEDERLEQFLSAADVWLIPYRKNVAGVSVPSRFYNLLAIGRPIILLSEPDAEAAVIIAENDLGWVVRPGAPDDLARAIRGAFRFRDSSMAQRAIAVAKSFSPERAMRSYSCLIDELFRGARKPRQSL